MTGRTPYLRQRPNGSIEYYRPLPARLRPYFAGEPFVNLRGTVYRVFLNNRGRPEKDRSKLLPVYLRFHADIEARKLAAEQFRIITSARKAKLEDVARKWLDFAHPCAEPRRLIMRAPPGQRVTAQQLKQRLEARGRLHRR